MISFAQNHEDVLLARAFAGERTGFYVDVGAFDPTSDSVTRHFYDMGWHGINIEPQHAYALRLREARPRDITLEVAVSDRHGTATLYEVSAIGDGVATIDPTWAGKLRAQERISGESIVRVTTLADVLAEHVDAGTQISFLKIDVEGHERAVLAGAEWARHAPRIVVVEATEPMTTIPSHQMWEPILIDAGYLMAQFDGLNRWYARADETRLIELLSVPVNALDKYAPYAWVARVEDLRDQVDVLTDKLAAATADPVRGQDLIATLETLQQRYQRLSAALDHERVVRAQETQRLSGLATTLRDLDGRSGQ